jgi:glucosylceramidase
MYKSGQFKLLSIALLLLLNVGCKKKTSGGDIPVTPPKEEPVKTDVAFYLTTPDRFNLFKKQNTSLLFSTASNLNPTIEVDESKTFQSIDGFGYTLTGGSASLINSLSSAAKEALLKELFLTDSTNIGISYLRISVGASDLSEAPFTYDDLSAGQIDLSLQNFTLDRERRDLIPVLKQIVALNPSIKILGSPWSAPTWMKTNNSFIGGKLKPEYYEVYAAYLVKYIQAMKEEGITIDALTPQNEPLHDGNNPSMVMLANEQADFIKNHLGPAFEAARVTTKIIIYDHNADKPDYPISILNDPQAKKYIDGSAFHLYGGDISALTTVHNAHPDKGLYFTEQWVGGPGDFAGDLQWHVSTLIVGATLAADQNYKPHTTGGCTTCLGALTISGNTVSRNVSYYVIAHASKFARPGSYRIESNNIATLQNVAFRSPDGKKVLVIINTGKTPQTFNIKSNGKYVTTTLVNGAVGTYVW